MEAIDKFSTPNLRLCMGSVLIHHATLIEGIHVKGFRIYFKKIIQRTELCFISSVTISLAE